MPLSIDFLQEKASEMEKNINLTAVKLQQYSGAYAVLNEQIQMLLSEQEQDKENGKID